MENVLLYFSLKYFGDWDKIYEALDKKEKIDPEELSNVKDRINTKFITILDSNYPQSLKHIEKPPFVIFYDGDIELLDNFQKIIGFVGGDNPTDYNEENISNFCNELIQENKTLITINYPGSNEIVLQKTIQISKELIYVLDDSILEFKQEHINTTNQILKNKGLIISENYSKSLLHSKLKHNYANRLFTGLCRGILFSNFKDSDFVKSIVGYAMNFGKDLFAIPDNINQRSESNKLIKQGVKLVENTRDILVEI